MQIEYIVDNRCLDLDKDGFKDMVIFNYDGRIIIKYGQPDGSVALRLDDIYLR